MTKLPTLKPRVYALAALAVSTSTGDERIRGTTLQAIRKAHFERHPLCVRCLSEGRTRIATELDHIIPLHRGGKDTLDPFENRQGLCTPCHQAKSATEEKKRGGGAQKF